MDHTTITCRRSELYEHVWTEPMTKVAARFGISDVALAKICRKLGVPSPRRGYWAKKSAGRTPKRPLLPPLGEGEKEEVAIRRAESKQAGAGVAPHGPNPEVIVHPTLELPHDLVAATVRELRTAKASYDGMVLPMRANGRLNVRVAPASLDRALRILDALLKACERHGIAVEIASLERGGSRWRSVNRELKDQTCLRIHGETLTFSLREHWSLYRPPVPEHLKRPSRARELRHWQWLEGRSRRVPNGTFELQVDGEYDTHAAWKDSKRHPLESCLGEVVARMPALAMHAKEQRAEQERRQKAEHEAQLRRWRAEENAERERRRVSAFRQRIALWRLARDIREYVAEAQAALPHGARIGSKSAEDELAWALAYAARVDPLR